MATAGGANTVVDGLVFGYDTGYPLVSGSSDTYKFNRGEPTTTFDVGDMTPSSPNTFFTSSASYDSNLHGTVWDWSFYPNSNPSAEGGMEWHPNIEGPGFKGAWLMKKRPGGNSESNFSGNAPGTIESTSAYTVSVWCKTDQASCFRIHINTTKDGSSYWGYSSGYHTGGGEWERLSVTIPANEGNTNIGVIRCQAIGTTITADAYFRNYQVEQRDHATPFILGGTRSVSGSLIDLTRTFDINLSNVSFDSNAQMIFDGTDDHARVDTNNILGTFSDWSVDAWIRYETDESTNWMIIVDQAEYSKYYKNIMVWLNNSTDAKKIAMYDGSWQYSNSTIPPDTWTHIAATTEGQVAKMYINGKLDATRTYSWNLTDNVTNFLGIGGTSNNPNYRMNGNIAVVKIYNKTLSDSEVQQNYNAIKERFSL